MMLFISIILYYLSDQAKGTGGITNYAVTITPYKLNFFMQILYFSFLLVKLLISYMEV